MVVLTQSLEHWLFENHRDKVGLILFGNIAILTEEMFNEYLQWCKTDDGKQYLVGGSKYNSGHKSLKMEGK